MTKRLTLQQEGYTHIKTLGYGEHLLKNKDGKLEIWFCNKNTACHAMQYKNTHLEFATSASAI